MTIFFGSVSGRKGGIVNRRNHSFVMESKLHDVKGRVDYISSPKRQENLYASFPMWKAATGICLRNRISGILQKAEQKEPVLKPES